MYVNVGNWWYRMLERWDFVRVFVNLSLQTRPNRADLACNLGHQVFRCPLTLHCPSCGPFRIPPRTRAGVWIWGSHSDYELFMLGLPSNIIQVSRGNSFRSWESPHVRFPGSRAPLFQTWLSLSGKNPPNSPRVDHHFPFKSNSWFIFEQVHTCGGHFYSTVSLLSLIWAQIIPDLPPWGLQNGWHGTVHVFLLCRSEET